MPDPVILRPMVPSDEGYLYDTWLRDMRDADSSGLPNDLWYPAHRAHIERVLKSRAFAVVIAAASDAPKEILGYVVAQPGDLLEWIHVRKPLRGKGIAKRLLQSVLLPDPAPARWQTPAARKHLRFQLVSRQLRKRETPPRSSEAPAVSSTR